MFKAYSIGCVLAALIFVPIAYRLGKQDGAHEAMERVYEAQQERQAKDIYELLGADLKKRIEAL